MTRYLNYVYCVKTNYLTLNFTKCFSRDCFGDTFISFWAQKHSQYMTSHHSSEQLFTQKIIIFFIKKLQQTELQQILWFLIFLRNPTTHKSRVQTLPQNKSSTTVGLCVTVAVIIFARIFADASRNITYNEVQNQQMDLQRLLLIILSNKSHKTKLLWLLQTKQ